MVRLSGDAVIIPNAPTPQRPNAPTPQRQNVKTSKRQNVKTPASERRPWFQPVRKG